MAEIGRRLKRKRKALGLTLAEAARLSGIGSYQKIYKIEQGKREVKADELVALARAYSFDLNLFLLGKSSEKQAQIFWRAEKLPEQTNLIESKFKMFFDRFFHLQEMLGYETGGMKLSLITRQITSVFDATEEGEKYSSWLNLGDRPALTFRRILEEEYNLPIFFFDMPEYTSAVSIISHNYSAIFVNKKDAPWRRNFDIAHELFHVIYQQVEPKQCGASNNRAQEMFANAFASAFLLPRDSIEREISKRREKSTIKLSDLIILACDYDVSIDALLWRLVNLRKMKKSKVQDILSDDAVKDYYNKLRQTKTEKTPYISDKYLCLIFDAVIQGKMSEMSASEYLDVAVGETERIFADAGLVWEGEPDIAITV